MTPLSLRCSGGSHSPLQARHDEHQARGPRAHRHRSRRAFGRERDSSSGSDAMTPVRRLGVAVASVLALLSALLVPMGAVAASPSILVSRVATSNKVMALTFDIGSDVANVPRILTVLADHGVKSTFFATG